MKHKSSKIILITGPASCGKSEWAEKLAEHTEKEVIYLATSVIDTEDKEWLSRIQKHQQRRPHSWQNIEETLNISEIIKNVSSSNCLLIDSLGTWVANSLYPQELDETDWGQLQTELLTALQITKADVILVGEETGWGVIPAYQSGRKFRQRLGVLVRMIAAIANPVYLVTAGYVLNLSLLGQPLNSPS